MKACHIIPILFSMILFSGDQMSLTFSRHEMMNNASNLVLCTEVAYKRYLVIQ